MIFYALGFQSFREQEQGEAFFLLLVFFSQRADWPIGRDQLAEILYNILLLAAAEHASHDVPAVMCY